MKQLAKRKHKNTDEEKIFYRNRIDHLQKRIEDFQKEKAKIHPAKGSSAYFSDLVLESLILVFKIPSTQMIVKSHSFESCQKDADNCFVL